MRAEGVPVENVEQSVLLEFGEKTSLHSQNHDLRTSQHQQYRFHLPKIHVTNNDKELFAKGQHWNKTNTALPVIEVDAAHNMQEA